MYVTKFVHFAAFNLTVYIAHIWTIFYTRIALLHITLTALSEFTMRNFRETRTNVVRVSFE